MSDTGQELAIGINDVTFQIYALSVTLTSHERQGIWNYNHSNTESV